MTSEGQVGNLTSGEGHDLIRIVLLHIIRFVSWRRTHWTCFGVCILSQSNVIAKKPVGDPRWHHMAPTVQCRDQGCICRLEWLEYTHCGIFGLFAMLLTRNRMNLISPIDLQGGGRKNDLPYVADMVHPVTLNKWWKFQSNRTGLVVRARVWFFSEVGSLNLPAGGGGHKVAPPLVFLQ